MTVDLTEDMTSLWRSLGPAPPGRCNVILFAAARNGEGVSTVARDFAQFAARRSQRSVWLVDLDLSAPSQHAAIASDPGRFGQLGRAAAASPDGSTFYTVQPPTRGPDGKAWPDARYLVAHAVGGGHFWVTRFRSEILGADQRPVLSQGGDYWRALRRHAEWVIIDAPAAERSGAALAAAPWADRTVLVVSADLGRPAEPAALKGAIQAAGGRCAGLFVNRLDAEPPAAVRALFG